MRPTLTTTLILAICICMSGIISSIQGLNSIRREALRGADTGDGDAISWVLFAAGLFVVLLGAFGTYGNYAQIAPWQRKRAGAFVPIGVGWLVAGILAAPIALVGQVGVTTGEYRAQFATGDASWTSSTWFLFWLPYAIGAAFLITGIVALLIGLRQFRADSAFNKAESYPLDGPVQGKGRVISVQQVGESLDEVVVEADSAGSLVHIVCVTDNAGNNGWMVDPERKVRVDTAHNPAVRGDARGWHVRVSTWWRMAPVRLQPQKLREVALLG